MIVELKNGVASAKEGLLAVYRIQRDALEDVARRTTANEACYLVNDTTTVNMPTDGLKHHVIDLRAESLGRNGLVGAFARETDAQSYVNHRYEQEGPHGPSYDVRFSEQPKSLMQTLKRRTMGHIP